MKPLIIERPYLLLSLSSRSCARLSDPGFDMFLCFQRRCPVLLPSR